MPKPLAQQVKSKAPNSQQLATTETIAKMKLEEKKALRALSTLDIDKNLLSVIPDANVLRDLYNGNATPESEGDYKAMYIALLNKTHRVAQGIEQNIVGTPTTREVYALMTLYSQQREIINDLRAIRGLDTQVDMIIETVIKPSFKAIAQGLNDLVYQTKRDVRNGKSFSREQVDELNFVLDDKVSVFATALQDGYSNISIGIRNMLTEAH